MISQEDIDAWREDEVQTEFLARERRRADNHLGWVVQQYGKEWKVCTHLFPDKRGAMEALSIWIEMWPKLEFRVYEVVKEKL